MSANWRDGARMAVNVELCARIDFAVVQPLCSSRTYFGGDLVP
jgi:hypothetical protein